MTMRPCPERKANCLSKAFFFWITRLIIDGFRRPLVFEDLWDLNPGDTSAAIIPKFERKWKRQIVKSGWQMVHKEDELKNGKLDEIIYEDAKDDDKNEKQKDKSKEEYVSLKSGKKTKEPSFTKALIGSFGLYFGLGGLLKITYDVISFANPQLLNLLITFIATRDPDSWKGYLYAGLMFFFALLRSLINQHYWHICFRTGMNVRSAVIGSVYRKALKLNNSARKGATVGEIVNLMSVDAQKLQDCTRFIHMTWSSPLILAIALYFLWQLLGPSVLAGLAALVLLIPLNAVLAQKNRILQMRQMKQKDKRIKLTNEVLGGIKVLKLYAWEDSFRDQLSDIRNGELSNLRTMAFLNAGTSLSFMLAPYLVALATFATYVLSSPDNILDANKAFVSLSLFNLINYPMSILPGLIAQLVQANISIKRLTKFLLNEELDPENVHCNEQEESVIKMEGCDFGWDRDEDPTLKSLNFSVKEGSLVGVVGAVGSGKSSLISAVLGEMEVIKGKIHVKGKVSYVPQQAWIQNATVRGNILFGKEFSCEKYTNCIEACALESDYKIMPAGDETEIGEKGINLSGGQKQRISLARAVYQNNDVYLLDDPLSAVDSHVGKHIFDNVLGPQGLLRNKTRILVTNGLTFLPKVDFVIVLKDGEISEMGSYEELLSHNGAFAEFIATYLQEHMEEDTNDPELMEIRAQLSRQISALSQTTLNSLGCDAPGTPTKTICTPKDRMAGNCAPSKDAAMCKIPGPPASQKNKGGKLVEEEGAQTGDVKASVIWTFVKACGFGPSVLVILFYISFLTTGVATNIWLSEWSNDANSNNTNGTDMRDRRLAVYGGLGAIQATVVVCQAFATAVGMVNASRILHQRLITNIVRAPMSFFDTTPLGRIINRFSKDIDVVDLNIPMTFRIWLGTLAGVLTTIVVISYSTPIFLAVVVPLFVMYYFVQRMYVQTARQLKRIDSVRRSPIFTHFSESISGASSIRAYGLTEDFTDISDQLVDENNMVMYPAMIANRWLGLYLECVGNLVVLFAALFVVIQRESINAGLAGLSVAYSLQITISLNIMVQMTSDLETYVVAVERIVEYADTPQEAPAVVEDKTPAIEWPEKGQVVMENYSTRYREGLDLVLRNVSFTINPGEKVGIVGRTGAGKSSLTLALFRLIESVTGKVVIDHTDVTPIGLKDLRSKITIIPQDPVVFSGTLRMNLDPFASHTDKDVWVSLENAHLKEFVSSLKEGLEFQCSEGGENLSVGQRQLLCLARALLRKTKILVLDEATAAVDMATDDLIQNTIRTEFADSTIITIAHRLNTIMDYDRIMVLDKGEIAELDSPSRLLQNSSSIFYSMARDAGLVRDQVVGDEVDTVEDNEDAEPDEKDGGESSA